MADDTPPETAPSAPPLHPTLPAEEHPNIFVEESDFIAHYTRAMAIARNPLNHVRTYEGLDLLGVPQTDEHGRVKCVDGDPTKPLWLTPPIDGWVPEDMDNPAGPWRRVPFLAPYLQTVLVNKVGDSEAWMRITPEVRVVLHGTSRILLRVLSSEINIPGPIGLTSQVADLFKSEARPYLGLWYPLHTTVESEWHGFPPQTTDDGSVYTPLLLRFWALHENAAAGPRLVTPADS